MRRFAIWTSVATILILNVVLWLGLLDPAETLHSSGKSSYPDLVLLFGWMLTALHVVLPISSVLMVTLLVKDRHWKSAALFAAIIAGMIVVVTWRLTGQKFSLGLHLGTDLCALNAYLTVVPWYRSTLARKGVA